jgi:hypothetical protein
MYSVRIFRFGCSENKDVVVALLSTVLFRTLIDRSRTP